MTPDVKRGTEQSKEGAKYVERKREEDNQDEKSKFLALI